METTLSPSLHIIAGENPGKVITLDGQKEFIIGRHQDCNLILLSDPLISRKHARFFFEDGKCWVENLGSLNGVFVNRERISAKCALNAGDQIIIGNHKFEIKFGEPKSVQGGIKAEAPIPEPKPAEMPPLSRSASQDAFRRLSLFGQLTRAAAKTNGANDLMRFILNLIFQDLRVSRGAAFLYSKPKSEWLPLCFKTRGMNDSDAAFTPPPELVNIAVGESRARVFTEAELAGKNLTFAVVLPLMLMGHLGGIIYLEATQKDFGFDQATLEFLETLTLFASTALDKADLLVKLQQEELIISRLEKHVGSDIVRMNREKNIDILKSELDTQEKEVAILFSDIAGFTSLSESMSPADTAFLLNGYFNHMADCVKNAGGYLNKYIGDAVMAVFGAPTELKNASENAVRCALSMLQKLQEFWNTIDEKKRFKIRIGINTGIVTAGNIGSLNRMEYTVIGDTVNVASRLESKAEPMGILIGQRTYEMVRDLFPARQLGSIQVKGKTDALQVYQIGASLK